MDPARFERQARQTYEYGRFRSATVLMSPALIPIIICTLFSQQPILAGFLGLALILVGIIFLWRGLFLSRALIAGLVAGSIPLGLVFSMRLFHHSCCIGNYCYSWCIPACVAGGTIASILVCCLIPKNEQKITQFWLAAAVVALLTGSLGCLCMSVAATLALLGSFVISVFPAFSIRKYAFTRP